MPNTTRSKSDVDAMAGQLMESVGEKAVTDIARACGFVKRVRDISPLGLLVACVSTLGASDANWLADILRSFNAFTGKTVQYKPFHNQLSKKAFPEFLRLILERVLNNATMPVLQTIQKSKLAMFQDILMHDGTSFAVKAALAARWPGRFTKVSPAAVELHVTMSALEDNPVSVILAPDKESERGFAPFAEDIKGKLLLEDRGFQDRWTFLAIQDAEGFYVVRGTKSIKPTIRAAYDERGNPIKHLKGKTLSWKILPKHTVDLDIEWEVDKANTYHGRLVAIYKAGRRNTKTYTYLHTNLLRDTFSWSEVGNLYRLRWQIELLFKQWKSHANLHAFDTSKSGIAEGLIWASLLAATLKRILTHSAELVSGVELSTERASASGKHFLDNVLRALLDGGRRLVAALRASVEFLRENARRAHPARDRKKGRLSAGLQPITSS